MTAASESINTKRGVRNPRNLGRTLSSLLSSRFEILFKLRKGLTKNGSTVFYMLKEIGGPNMGPKYSCVSSGTGHPQNLNSTVTNVVCQMRLPSWQLLPGHHLAVVLFRAHHVACFFPCCAISNRMN